MEKFLCNMCNQDAYDKKWIPNSVSDFEVVIGGKIFNKNIRKNIVYNLQFLQFINEYINQLYLTSVIYTLSCKIFVIITASIVEGILFYEIHSQGLQKKSVWNFLKKLISNENVISGDKKLRLETMIFEKMENEKDEDMNFDQMINIAESKNLLGNDHGIYEKINGLRKLRNKIHLHVIEHNNDNDYNNYDFTKIELAKEVLVFVLKDYFKVREEEINEKFIFLKPKEVVVPSNTVPF